MMFTSNHGGGEDSDSTWDDFSLANGQRRSQSSSPASAAPHTTSQRGERDAWHSDSRQRDTLTSAGSHNRSLPSQPLERGHDSAKPTIPKMSGKQRRRTSGDFTSGNELSSSGQGYKPSFHAKVTGTRSPLRNGHVPSHHGNSEDDDVDREMSRPNTSGNPPFDFSNAVPRSQASANPPMGHKTKQAYMSGSSLEQVSSQIFDDESDRRQPHVVVSDETHQLRQKDLEQQRQQTRKGQWHLRDGIDEVHPSGTQHSDNDGRRELYEPVAIGSESLLERKGKASNKWTRHQHTRHGSRRHTYHHHDDGLVVPHRNQQPSPPNFSGHRQSPRQPTNELEKEHEYLFAKMETSQLTALPPDPQPYMVGVARRAEKMFERLWRELFAALSILVTFVITFAIQLLHFVANSLLKKPLVGFLLIFGDHLFKPLLSAFHNCFIQPCVSFGWNLFGGIVHMFSPLLNVVTQFIELLTEMVRAFRLVEIVQERRTPQQEHHVQTV